MRTKKNESEATRQASAELQAIVGELEAIKVRLLTTAKRLKAADGAVVAVDPEGEPLTVEGWTADLIGDETPEVLDDLLRRIGQAADPGEVRASIRYYLETERRIEAKIAARQAAGN